MINLNKDWKTFCSEIRDQGNCGSCTAFGIIGAWEPNLRIIAKIDADLSEKDLFFCSGGMCQLGNTMDNVLNRALKGVAIESCDPYVDVDSLCGWGRCDNWWETGFKLDKWQAITKIEGMKNALNKAPLVGVMDVHESFLHYVDGVYHSLGTFDPIVGGHCIAIIGYDDEKGAWHLRNSWGTGWGMQGYAWVQYGDSAIDDIMYSITLSANKPEPEPNPSPCTIGNGLAKIGNFFAWLLHRKGRFYYLNS